MAPPSGPMSGVMLGVLAGFTASSITGHWLTLVMVSMAKHGGDFLGPPRRRLIGLLPFATLLHPRAWLVGAALYFTGRILFRGLNPLWTWVAFGFYCALGFFGVAAPAGQARKNRRKRKIHQKQTK